jgi:hypothetical protein
MFKLIGKTLRAIAPTLLQALPIPGLGNMAKTAITKVFDLPPTASDSEIEDKFKNATPEQIIALKKAEQDYKLELKRLDIDLAAINAKDRDSARNREKTLKDATPKILAFTMIIGLFGFIALLAFFHINPSFKEVLVFIGGELTGYVTAIMAYYFGSSSDSRKKTAIISDLQKSILYFNIYYGIIKFTLRISVYKRKVWRPPPSQTFLFFRFLL